MDESAWFARHLAFGLGAIETLAGVALAAGIWLIGSIVDDPDPIGSAILIGIAIFAIAFPASVMVLAMAHRKPWVVYACCAVLVAYPTSAITAYSIYG